MSRTASDRAHAPLLRRLRELPGTRQGRLDMARSLAADPEVLGDELLRSAAAARDWPGGTLRAGSGRPVLVRELGEVIHRDRAPRTGDFAFWLQSHGYLSVALDPHLDARYVDRELPIAIGSSVGDGGGRRARALRLDLLLSSAAPCGTPILAEVKIGADKDPFAALLQVLTALALLHTPACYERLRATHPAAGFTPLADGPPAMDAYVMCVDSPWHAPLMTDLLLVTRELARGLSVLPATAGLLRRAVLLELRRTPTGLWSQASRL